MIPQKKIALASLASYSYNSEVCLTVNNFLNVCFIIYFCAKICRLDLRCSDEAVKLFSLVDISVVKMSIDRKEEL